jgi:hypothetical protein
VTVCLLLWLPFLAYGAVSTLFENFRSLKTSLAAETDGDVDTVRQVNLANMEIVEKVGE